MKKSIQEIVRRTRGRDSDLFDLRRLMGDKLEAAGWDGIALLGEWVATDPSTSSGQVPGDAANDAVWKVAA